MHNALIECELNSIKEVNIMKVAFIMFFSIAIIGAFALVNMSSSSPSAFTVQPSKEVLGYCPVRDMGKPCYIGGRMGDCLCQTDDEYLPKYGQMDNCACMVPRYSTGPTFAQP